MAGAYADVPGVRIPYHLDGSLVRWISTVKHNNLAISGGWTNWAASDVNEMNDGDVANVTNFDLGAWSGRYTVWLFPQPITLLGHNILMTYFGGTPSVSNLEYSTDTTDGVDGTWNTTPNNLDQGTNASALRQITAVNILNVRCLRLFLAGNYEYGGSTFQFRDVAFYGTWTPATLAGWHPTLDQQLPAAYLDFGDIALGTSVTKQFRIKNGRGQQANNVVVSPVAGNTQTAAGMSVSLDNTTFSPTVSIASIASGAISPVIYLKRSVGAGETVGNIGICYVQFVAGSWT